jgi:thiol-disulfide isomerase/thioredoxin
MTSETTTVISRRGLSLLLAGACCVALWAPAVGAQAAAPRIGAPAPPLLLRTLEGAELDLGRPTGQVVVVNLWATWCTPCRAEMPMLNAFYQQYRPSGVLVVGVSTDRSRDAAEVRAVMRAFAYPAGLLADARTDLDAPRVMPMTYVIDRQGVVRAMFDGMATKLDAARLESAVRPLI